MELLLFQDQVLNIKHTNLEIPKMFQHIKPLLHPEFIKVLDIKVEPVLVRDQDLDQESIKADQECIKVDLDQVFTKVDQETIKPVPLEPINQPQELIKSDPQEHQEAQVVAIKLAALEVTKPEAINHTKLDPLQALINLELIEHPLVLLEQLELPVQVEQLAQPVQLAAAFLLPIDTRRNEQIDL